jgi:hypothetical protein
MAVLIPIAVIGCLIGLRMNMPEYASLLIFRQFGKFTEKLDISTIFDKIFLKKMQTQFTKAFKNVKYPDSQHLHYR